MYKHLKRTCTTAIGLAAFLTPSFAYVTIATVIFSRVKIYFRPNAHLTFHFSLYIKVLYDNHAWVVFLRGLVEIFSEKVHIRFSCSFVHVFVRSYCIML